MDKLQNYLNHIARENRFNQASFDQVINQVEIIVPIFNGFEALKLCISALLEHTDCHHKVQLLNDASTDAQVAPYLNQLALEHDHVSVTHRSKNLGYLKNVNPFLIAAKNDVLLLNSDTRVTEGWINEMIFVAQDKLVGSVCPLSDEATILSIDNITAEQLVHLKDFSSKWYPIPTAVGFCMLLKKAVLKELGGFDPYYDPGYGEECDHSMLIRQLGLQIACAPAAFVFHQGSASFKNKATKLQAQHQKLLDLRWPQYAQEVAHFMAINPVKLIEQYIQAKDQSKPRILHVSHGIDNIGGVELFTRQLLNGFNDDFAHCLLIPKRPFNQNNSINHDSSFEIMELTWGTKKPDHIIFNIPADLNNETEDVFFKHLLHYGQFKLVHFHSLVGVGTALWPLICHQLGIPYHLFLHDHSGLCQIFSLSSTVNNQEVYCGKKRLHRESSQCQLCIQNKTQKSKLTPESYLAAREGIWNENLSHAKQLIFPSQYLLNIYLESFSEFKFKSSVFSPCFYQSKTTAVKKLNPNNITIAFLGQFGVLKGAQLFIDLYHKLNDANLSWKIIGGVDPKFHSQLHQTQIELTDEFDSTQLGARLRDVDMIVFTAQIPETYGITLTEAWIHGIPVVAPKVGAYKSRVNDQVNGVLYESNQLSSLINAIRSLVVKQNSDDRINQIEYQSQSRENLKDLEESYQRDALPSVLRLPTNNTSITLSQPKNGAYQLMQEWLDSPATLEAEADWKKPPNGLQVCILGDQTERTQSTKDSINAHIESAQFIPAKELMFATSTDIILLIETGSQVNDNLGNWIASFSAKNCALGLADFALCNLKNQTYAPQFEGRFSWTNYLSNNQQIGCALINLKHWPKSQRDKLLVAETNLKTWVQSAHELTSNPIDYFPHFSYTMSDVNWVVNWKQQLGVKSMQRSLKTHNLLILVETNLVGQEKLKLINMYKSQSLVSKGNVNIEYCCTKNKRQQVEACLNKPFSHRLFLADNIKFKHRDALCNLLIDFDDSLLDVATITSSQDPSQQYLVAKKQGAASHFYGVGRIKDLRFMPNRAAVEYDLIDEDFVIFKESVLDHDMVKIIGSAGYYQNLKLSNQLQKKDLITGIIRNNNIYKQGLPSQDILVPVMDLKAQRNAVIKSKTHVLKPSHFSNALSCRFEYRLDLNMACFKTPKTLPRVIAYAQDEWASGFYRIKSPLTALASANLISIHFLSTHSNGAPTPYEINRFDADVILLHGFYSDQQLAALNQYRKQLDIRIFLSIDDLLTQIPNYNPFSSKTPEDMETRIKLACSVVDGLIVSTANLAKHFSQFHQNIQVIPNRLSNQIWPPDKLKVNTHKKLKVGWAGAGQHQADLDWLIPVVEKTHHLYDWVFFGDLPEDLDPGLVTFHEPVDLYHYPQQLKQLGLDIAVAPLVDNPFNLAKSPLKLIEFGALGIPVIASNLACYEQSPATLLENNTDLWVTTLADFNQDRASINKAGQKLQDWVIKNHYLEDHLSQWLDVLKLS